MALGRYLTAKGKSQILASVPRVFSWFKNDETPPRRGFIRASGDCNRSGLGLGESLLGCGERDLVSQFCREISRLSSFQPPPTPLPDAWIQDALGPGK